MKTPRVLECQARNTSQRRGDLWIRKRCVNYELLLLRTVTGFHDWWKLRNQRAEFLCQRR